jgi:hypothetical protein
MAADWILDNKVVKEAEATTNKAAGCCSGRQAMPTHGGGRATSEQNSQNGSTATSKV